MDWMCGANEAKEAAINSSFVWGGKHNGLGVWGKRGKRGNHKLELCMGR